MEANQANKLKQISIVVRRSMENKETIELFESQNLLYKQMFAYLQPKCLRWAVELGIPDIIHNHGKPITLSELVSTLQIPSAKACYVQRLMRFLAHNGIFDIHDSQQDHQLAYALTPASKLLVKASAHCLSPMILMSTRQRTMNKFDHLVEWIQEEGDRTLFETARGTRFWEFLEKDPTSSSVFDEAMASDSKLIDLAIKNCTSVFEELDSIVDVGGGNGTTARIISETFPKLKCVVFDLPRVVANLTGSSNLSFVGGDMFKSIPQANAALLKWVLHNWNDENCMKILQKCKDSISGKGRKVIIIDAVINEKTDDRDITQTQLSWDLGMMSFYGKERTEKEWKQLFTEAGFKHYKIFPVFGYKSLIEVYP